MLLAVRKISPFSPAVVVEAVSVWWKAGQGIFLVGTTRPDELSLKPDVGCIGSVLVPAPAAVPNP